MKIAFFELKDQDKKDFYTKSLSGHELFFSDQVLDKANIPDQVDFDVISTFVKSKLDAKVINSFPNLKLVIVRATGFDNVDLETSKAKNIIVANVPSYGSHTVAEFTFALILNLSRKITEAVNKEKQTFKFNYQGLRGFDLNQKTIGVIGTGKIGLNVIKVAKAFEMKVLAYDVFKNDQAATELGFEYTDLDNLLGDSDIITIHAPLTPETTHLINKQNITKIKKGCILINTARGPIVETEALIEALNNKTLSAAAVDVLEEEQELADSDQKFRDHPLSHRENVIITPHMAFYTKEAEDTIQQTTVDNIKGVDSGNPTNKVN